MVSRLVEKIVAVSRSEHRHSHTVGHDMELYKTLIWDLSEIPQDGWTSADPSKVLDLLCRDECECLALSDLPDDIRDLVDARLRQTTGYIGAFALDPANPVQRRAFYDDLLQLGAINGGAVIQELSVEGDPDWPLQGAERYRPGGLEWKPHFWSLSDEVPRLAKASSVSKRGEKSLRLLYDKRQPSIEARVFEGLAIGSGSDWSGIPYEFASVENVQDVLQAVLPEGKFTRYLFDPSHKDGRSKAKFFIETLKFSPDDWRYLAAQFYEALVRANPQGLVVQQWPDGYGARFNVVVRVRSRTGETGVVRTGWMLRPNQLPSLSTAIPEDAESDAIDPGAPPIGIPSAQIDEFWRSVYDLAHAEGVRAHERAVPTPMTVEGWETIPDGKCGNAGINVKDARRGFARWLLKTGLGYRGYRGGASLMCGLPSQSYDRALAYAKAFARVLILNGVSATVQSYYD